MYWQAAHVVFNESPFLIICISVPKQLLMYWPNDFPESLQGPLNLTSPPRKLTAGSWMFPPDGKGETSTNPGPQFGCSQLKVTLLVSMLPWHVCCISHRHCHQQIPFFNLPWSEWFNGTLPHQRSCIFFWTLFDAELSCEGFRRGSWRWILCWKTVYYSCKYTHDIWNDIMLHR